MSEPEPETVPFSAQPEPEEFADSDLPPQVDARPPPRPPAFPVDFALLAAGGAAFAAEDQPTGSGTVTLDAALTPRWGLAVDVGAQSDRARVTSTNDVVASLHWAGVSGRVAFNPGGANRAYLSAGLQLVHLHLSGRTQGFQQGTADNFLPAFALHAETRHVLPGGALFLLTRVSLDIRVRAEGVQLGDATLVIPPWTMGAQLGLGWNFF